MKVISSRQNPVVSAFREVAASPDAHGQRVLLDGAHLVRDARDAGLAFEVVVVASSSLDAATEEGALASDLARANVAVIAAADRVFDAVSPARSPSGIVAIARRVPAPPAAVCAGDPSLVVAAVDVQDPGNVGSLIRAAEAGGATGALVCGRSANPFSWKALRGSMGSALRLPVAAGLTAESALECMSGAGLRTVAAVPRGGDAPDALDWTGRVGLLLGGEGPGLPDGLSVRCDARVTIPMSAPVESLNVAVAGAILVYAARRQRS